ncbi:MAG: glutathione S-transferase family protein [Polyangiaceae bacterium]|nr:glutathione S-transferase family protein [Polyangiaceae bacterium]
MRLYYNPFSNNSRRAHLTALLLGVDIELALVDLPKGEQRQPLHLQRNPNGRVPVLDDDGFLLWESRAIMQYLADKAPGQTLYPSAARPRADVNRWLFWDAAHLAPAVGVLTFERFVKRVTGRGDPDPVEVRRGEGLIAQVLPVLDGHLAGKTWVTSDRMTLADVTLAATLSAAPIAGIDLEPYANVRTWQARLRDLEAWKATEPPRPPGK